MSPGGIYQPRGSRHKMYFYHRLVLVRIDMLLKEQAAFMKRRLINTFNICSHLRIFTVSVKLFQLFFVVWVSPSPLSPPASSFVFQSMWGELILSLLLFWKRRRSLKSLFTYLFCLNSYNTDSVRTRCVKNTILGFFLQL